METPQGPRPPYTAQGLSLAKDPVQASVGEHSVSPAGVVGWWGFEGGMADRAAAAAAGRSQGQMGRGKLVEQQMHHSSRVQTVVARQHQAEGC
jgi:hypothetical protein